jgi:hypothetical protein
MHGKKLGMVDARQYMLVSSDGIIVRRILSQAHVASTHPLHLLIIDAQIFHLCSTRMKEGNFQRILPFPILKSHPELGCRATLQGGFSWGNCRFIPDLSHGPQMIGVSSRASSGLACRNMKKAAGGGQPSLFWSGQACDKRRKENLILKCPFLVSSVQSLS